jgi:hypothetical protein
MRGFTGFKAAFVGSAMLLGSATSLYAQPVPPVPPQPTNGLTIIPRFFNDFPNSTQTYQINGGPIITNPPANVGIPVPGASNSVIVHDTNMVNTPPSGFANRNDLLLSTNAGASPFVGSINTPFFQTATLNLTDLNQDPRKEAGIRVDAPVTGDAVFEVNSDGEIVAFGGGAPFFNFRPNIEAAYLPGQTITLSEQYTPGPGGTTNANPGTMQYWAQLSGGPLLTSGPLAWSNLEGGPGPNSFNIGAFTQEPDANPGAGINATANDFINVAFSGISGSVPEPASFAMIGFGGLALLGRRRQRVA